MSIDQAQRPLYEVKAGLFKGLSHPLRIRILELLADGEEHGVSELHDDTGLEASHLSQHLAVLRRHGLVLSERRGSNVYYRIDHADVAELLLIARRLLVRLVSDAGHQAEALTLLPQLSGVGHPGDAGGTGQETPRS